MVTLLIADGWRDYELLDSGDGKKLERWGQYLTIRPEPRAIWNKANQDNWEAASAVYEGEAWKFNSDLPKVWTVAYGQIKFLLKPTEFRHVGVFPEQAVNWQWLASQITNHKSQIPIKVLNLFAYTGGATIAAALAGAHITHVDASRPAMMWASENAKLSGVPQDRIRWIQDDVNKFVNREIRRGVKYDGIIMDPPRFGRGMKGEVWKLLDDLPELVTACKQILSPTPLFMLINAYTADMSSLVLKYLLEDMVRDLGGETESGELGLKESASGKILPAGIFARWKTVK
jgi:23S rRNA (cytosine1962-C5)-methyltransferase